MQQSIGTVYGVLLNERASLQRLGEQFSKDPYKAPPRAPILYIKPANTYLADGATVLIPPSPGRVQIGASIAAVIGRDATRVTKSDALTHVAGFRAVADISLPHANFYRPAIRERCRDGFCPIGSFANPAGFDASQALISVTINGQSVESRKLSDLVRPLAELLVDVTEFMTLKAGDLLLLGLSDQPPEAAAGDAVSIEVAGLGTLQFRIALEETLVSQ